MLVCCTDKNKNHRVWLKICKQVATMLLSQILLAAQHNSQLAQCYSDAHLFVAHC